MRKQNVLSSDEEQRYRKKEIRSHQRVFGPVQHKTTANYIKQTPDRQTKLDEHHKHEYLQRKENSTKTIEAQNSFRIEKT